MIAYARCPCCGVQQEQGKHSDQPDAVLPLTGAKTGAERERILAERRAVAQLVAVRRQWREGTVTTPAAVERLRDIIVGGRVR